MPGGGGTLCPSLCFQFILAILCCFADPSLIDEESEQVSTSVLPAKTFEGNCVCVILKG